MPRNGVAPICTVEDAAPSSINLAMERAVLIGIAYAWVSAEPVSSNPKPPPLDDAAVSIPMTSPFEFTNGPPESPGSILALTSIIPLNCSAPVGFSWSAAVID